jgi:hypothetical protein
VTPHSVFLRKECALPDGLRLLQEPFGSRWDIVEDMVAATLDLKIRSMGWHFMWLSDSSSHRGFGRTDETAIQSALDNGLAHIRGRFNAAELDSFRVARYPGFSVAHATLHACHIQQNAALDSTAAIGR